jgi:negative regulator of flagellin synthesis FlgM
MRIDPNQYVGNAQTDDVQQTSNRGAQQPSQTSATPDSAEVDPQDTFQVSGTLGEVQRLQDQLAQTPDVRSERVAALRQQVQQGTYRPSNEGIANAMIAQMGSSSRG